jgi:hypothetical protein
MKASEKKISKQRIAYITMMAMVVLCGTIIAYENKRKGESPIDVLKYIKVTSLPVNIYPGPADGKGINGRYGIGYIRQNVPIDSIYNDTMETTDGFVKIKLSPDDWFHMYEENTLGSYAYGWYKLSHLEEERLERKLYPIVYTARLRYHAYDPFLPDVVEVTPSSVIYRNPPRGRRQPKAADHLGILKPYIMYDSVYAEVMKTLKSKGRRDYYVYISFKHLKWFSFNSRSTPRKYSGGWFDSRYFKPKKIEMEWYIDQLFTTYQTAPTYPDSSK